MKKDMKSKKIEVGDLVLILTSHYFEFGIVRSIERKVVFWVVVSANHLWETYQFPFEQDQLTIIEKGFEKSQP